MAEAGAQPGQQQHEAWEVDGPSVGECLDYLDLYVDDHVEETRGRSQDVWRLGVVLEKRIDGEGRPEIKVHFRGLSPGYDRWISWGAERHQFAAQGTHSGRSPADSVNVGGGGRAGDDVSGSGSKESRAKRVFIGAVKGFIRSQQDLVAGTSVQRSSTPTAVSNTRDPTPTSAASNTGTPASASSSASRAAAGGGGGSSSEEAFFIEEERGQGISPTSPTTSASRRNIFRGKLQGFIRGQQYMVAGANITRGPAANNSAGTPSSTAGLNPNRNPFDSEENSSDRGELNEGEAFLEELENEEEEEMVVEEKEDEEPGEPKAVGVEKIVIRELTPHVIEEVSATVGGGYQLTVFRKNKQHVAVVEIMYIHDRNMPEGFHWKPCDEFPVPMAIGVLDTEVQAKRAAECYSSPVWHEPQADSRCADCDMTFSSVRGRRRHHCRNCGRLVCTHCAGMFWPESMLPHSYRRDSTERRVRICNKCFTMGQNFRSALLSGSEEQAMKAYETGCVNLRVPYTIYHNEFPVHCAAAGGNVSLLSWLIEDRYCPVFCDRSKTAALGDREQRSVMAAAVYSGQLEVMRYLAFTQPSTLDSLNEMKTLWRGLDTCLRYDEGLSGVRHSVSSNCYSIDHHDAWGKFEELDNSHRTANSNTSSDGVSTEEAYSMYDLPGGQRGEGVAVVGAGKNVCIKCFARKVDCTLVPCGHYCCCLVCAKKFDICPVCFKKVQERIKAIDV